MCLKFDELDAKSDLNVMAKMWPQSKFTSVGVETTIAPFPAQKRKYSNEHMTLNNTAGNRTFLLKKPRLDDDVRIEGDFESDDDDRLDDEVETDGKVGTDDEIELNDENNGNSDIKEEERLGSQRKADEDVAELADIDTNVEYNDDNDCVLMESTEPEPPVPTADSVSGLEKLDFLILVKCEVCNCVE